MTLYNTVTLKVCLGRIDTASSAVTILACPPCSRWTLPLQLRQATILMHASTTLQPLSRAFKRGLTTSGNLMVSVLINWRDWVMAGPTSCGFLIPPVIGIRFGSLRHRLPTKVGSLANIKYRSSLRKNECQLSASCSLEGTLADLCITHLKTSQGWPAIAVLLQEHEGF